MIHTLNCRGRLVSLEEPIVMGILNLTPDSFSDGGKYNQEKDALKYVEEMLTQGAKIIDIGGYSSRPDATDISHEEELTRIYSITKQILREFPDAIVSIDTFRASVAAPMIELGVHMINDISGGKLDLEMMPLIANWDVPYVMMHMKGTPQTMKSMAMYENMFEEIWHFFIEQINKAKSLGIKDIIIDPGFGFAKNIKHNYELLLKLDHFQLLDMPILVGLSRKSMLYRLLERSVEEMLAPTSIVNFKALEKGAHILRVHDVQEAVSCIRLFRYMQEIKMNEAV